MALYICSNCNYGSASWMGKCPDCGAWNTFEEQITGNRNKSKEKVDKIVLTPFTKITSQKKDRLKTGFYEFDRVLGGGILPGAVILLTGEPGIGKSTLLLQALTRLKTVYVSGEESGTQVKDRAERLRINLEQFVFGDTVQVEGIIAGLEELKDKIDIVVIDSIQTIYSKNIEGAAGSVSQLKATADQLTEFAKKNHLPILLIGHITKGGDVAGPKTLEHLVDCVLSFEGEKLSHFRILRALKNRFGTTDEIGIFEMKNSGLAAVDNPAAFIDTADSPRPGKVITAVVEGKRPLFFELQTLTVPSNLVIPRRVVRGVDFNKVQLLLAVIRKFLHFQLDRLDVFVNVVGGINIRSTAVDLAIAAATISSIKNLPLPNRSVFSGEIGLLGEIRPVFFQEKLILEARRLHFTQIFTSEKIRHIKDLQSLFTA